MQAIVSILRRSALLCGFASGAIAAPVTIELPPSATDLKSAAGIELAQANCLVCHSTDYIRTQPPMTRKFWEAEVKKMQQKYGMPFNDEQIPRLVDYLTASYGAR